MQKATSCGLLSLIKKATSPGPLMAKLLPHARFDLTIKNLRMEVNVDAAMMVPITGKAAHLALFEKLNTLAQHAENNSRLTAPY